MTDTTDLRAGLIESLRACRDAEREIFGALDPATRDAPGPDGAWSAKDHLAHLSAWRNRQAIKMAAAREGRDDPGLPSEVLDETNAFFHAERADWTWDEVNADAATTLVAFIAEIGAASDEALADQKVLGPILGDGPEHDLAHLGADRGRRRHVGPGARPGGSDPRDARQRRLAEPGRRLRSLQPGLLPRAERQPRRGTGAPAHGPPRRRRTSGRSLRRTTTSSPCATRSRPLPRAADRRVSDLDELAFLNEIAQLATQARDWDELMRSIVDGTTAAMRVEVCSFYIANHDRNRLTLAATNGLDPSQVGKVSLDWSQGITGRVAATRTPIAIEDVTRDDRFSWVRGFDMEGLAGMLSVPLIWHDDVVGVLNVQARGRAAVRGRRDRIPRHDRRAAGGHRREGPPDRRGRGAAGRADGAGRRPVRTHERRDP